MPDMTYTKRRVCDWQDNCVAQYSQHGSWQWLSSSRAWCGWVHKGVELKPGLFGRELAHWQEGYPTHHWRVVPCPT